MKRSMWIGLIAIVAIAAGSLTLVLATSSHPVLGLDLRGGVSVVLRPDRKVDSVCPYCGVGCTLTLHTQANRIVKVTSPLDVTITHGHLCIKGRFGFEFVQNRKD